MTAVAAAPPLEVWALSFLLILARVGAFVGVLPVFGGHGTPRIVKVGFAAALAVMWSMVFDGSANPTILGLAVEPHWLAYALAVAREAIFGAMLGYAFGLLLLPARVAGSYIGQEMGLTLATLTDPTSQDSLNVVGQVFDALAVLLFFALDIHHVLLGTLHYTLARWPVGISLAAQPALPLAAGLTEAHQWGLLLAAPLVVCMFMTIVVLALLMKISPQLNLFTVGLTLRLGVGLLATLVFLPEMMAMTARWLQQATSMVLRWNGQAKVAEESHHSKTEAATPRRREEARKKGQFAHSVDLNGGLLLLGGSLTLWLGGAWFARQLLQMMRSWLWRIDRPEWTSEQIPTLAVSMMGHVLQIAGPFIALAIGISFCAGAFQTGFRVSLEPLTPDWTRLSPANGWSRLFSSKSVMRGVMSVFKVAAVLLVVSWVVRGQVWRIAGAGDRSLAQAVADGWLATVSVAVAIAAAFVLTGLLDYLFQWWRHEQDLKMSRRDIKDEQKEEEGDPHVRARIKHLQREAAQRRSISEVPNATVVLINPSHLAVALRYDRATMPAPQVVAKGADLWARRIVDLARQHSIPVLERKPLARALYQSVEVGQDIPETLYRAIAEILAYVYRLRRAG